VRSLLDRFAVPFPLAAADFLFIFQINRLFSVRQLLHRIDERREPLHTHFQTVARGNGADAAGRAGQDDIARQQGHVCRNETHKLGAIEDELAGVRVLTQLAILEELNGGIIRIEFCFDVRPYRGKGVERLGAGPLALAILNRPIADVLS